MGDLDRRKHDVDVMERVIGDIQENSDGPPGRVIDVEVPSTSPIVELVVNLSYEGPPAPDRRRQEGPGRSS
jgi:hypothetical protein